VKKNKMLRLASVLLILVMLTTSIIGGTFAKYTTTASGSDLARVAKWGVEIATSGSLFQATYAKDDTTVTDASITNSVVSTGSVVAPGTKNERGITFTIKGIPEVAVRLDFAIASSETSSTTAKDVFLKAGTYADLTTGTSTKTVDGNSEITGNADTFTLDSDYYPITYTLKNSTDAVLATGKLSEIEAYLENLSGVYAPGTDLSQLTGKTNTDGTYTLTWVWEFTEDADTDKADTFLGALAANDASAKKGGALNDTPANGTDYCLTPDIVVTITATQID